MIADPTSTEGAEPSDDGAPSAPGWSNRDHAALPAPALGPKAAILQARRQQRLATRPGAVSSSEAGVRLSTADAALTFVMRGAGSALYLERTQRRPLGTHLVQSMVFASADEFRRWCDAEPLRFDDPNLHRRLRRHGEEFFGEPP
jgi:hypothetical protein